MKRERFKDEIPFKEMTRKQKISYIRDYYLVTILVVAAVVIGLCYLLYSMTHRTEVLLGVTLVDTLETERVEELVQEFAAERDIPEKSVQIGDTVIGSGGISAQASVAFYVRFQAGSEDIVILPEDTFNEYAENGYFLDLTDVVPAEWQDKLLVVDQVYDEYENVQPDPIACGIRVRDIACMPDDDYYENAVIAISYNPRNYDNAVSCYNFLLTK
jgi:hypothetical protein